MTTTSSNLIESVIKFALVVLLAVIVFQIIGVKLSAVANKVAESFQKVDY